MTKKVFEFKLKFDENELITPYAGLGIYGGMYRSIGLDKEIEAVYPRPGSGKGFEANTYIGPLAMMFIGGGRVMEDIRRIKADKALRKICKFDRVPTSDAIGDWLRRDSMKKVESTKEVNDNFTTRVVKRAKEEEFTLDIDAMGIEAEKREAAYTYKGHKGYMPLMGFIVELDWCCGYEFREGNVSPSDRNYEFTKELVELVEGTGKKISKFRSDSAGYEHKLINYLNGKGKRYTITADQDVAVKARIKEIRGTEWKELKDRDGIKGDRKYAEIIHSMNESDHAFRLVIQRWPNPNSDLFEETEEYCYHCVATNYLEEEKNAEEVIWWHNGRSNSENYNKEFKGGFNLDYMPCGEFGANAVWFGIGVLAYNLFIASKMYLFPGKWLRKTIGTIRWQFIQIAGKIISHAKTMILKLCSIPRETFEIYKEAMRKCCELQL